MVKYRGHMYNEIPILLMNWNHFLHLTVRGE